MGSMRRTGALAPICLCMLLAGIAASGQSEEAAPEMPVVQVVSSNVQGKNVYIPSTIVVAAGRPTALSLFNTTDVPHGFRIDGLDLETVLPVQEEHRLELPALSGGKIYEIRCQLHPAHRTGTLVVLDTE